MADPMRVRLRLLPQGESDALMAGRGAPPAGLGWDVDYPTEDTFIALGLLTLAHAASGRSGVSAPTPWWLHQIVVSGNGQDLVVGDIGYHGPPGPGPRAVVEIGYAVVPGWRGRGVASQACALIVEHAWRSGADTVRAEAESAPSQAVLRRCGFRALPDHWFEAVRP